MDKVVLSILVSLISGVIMAMVVGGLELGAIGTILLSMLAMACVSVQPRDNTAAELRHNLKLAALAAAVAGIISALCILAGMPTPAAAFCAALAASVAVNLTVIATTPAR